MLPETLTTRPQRRSVQPLLDYISLATMYVHDSEVQRKSKKYVRSFRSEQEFVYPERLVVY